MDQLQKTINVEEVHNKEYDGDNFGIVVLRFKGVTIYDVNSIRRAAWKNVPIYAFPEDSINVIKNTCIAADNLMMKTNLCQLPVLELHGNIKIDPELDYLHEKYWKNTKYNDVNRPKIKNENGEEIEKLIEILMKFKNTEPQTLKTFYTNDPNVAVYVENTKVDMYKGTLPIPLITLAGGEEFECHMRAVLGVGEKHAIFNSAKQAKHVIDQLKISGEEQTHVVFDTFNENNTYTLNVHPCGMLSNYKVIIRSINYILWRLDLTRNEITNMCNNADLKKMGELIFNLIGEDDTLGGIINYEFQSHPKLKASGKERLNFFSKEIKIKILYLTSMKKNEVIDVINQCFDNLIMKFKVIKTKVINLSKVAH